MDDRFQVEATLGRGSFATVYKAHDRLLGRVVALKVFDRLGGLSVTDRARFVREARILAQLDHPNVVRLYDASIAGRVPYLVLEYVEGRDLRDWLGTTPTTPDWGTICHLAESLLQALSYAHIQQVIHRDVKPENVLVISDEYEGEDVIRTVKLADFGLARLVGQTAITRADHIVGTAGYLAPEVMRGQPYSVRSDLYALGVLLYEVTTGVAPFPGESLEQILHQQLTGAPRSVRAHRPDAPGRLDALIMQLIERDPRERPVSALAALGTLNTIQFNERALIRRAADRRTAALRRSLGVRRHSDPLLDESAPLATSSLVARVNPTRPGP